MENKANIDRRNEDIVVIIDRKYLEYDIRDREKGLLNNNGKLDSKTLEALTDEIRNHTSGFLAGCYLNVLCRKLESTINGKKKRAHLKTMRSNS